MRQNYLIIIFSMLLVTQAHFAKSQWVTIPDPNFVSFLQSNFPSAMNGSQMNITDPTITSTLFVNCSFYNIVDLTGIEYFTSLQYLNCDNNSIAILPTLPVTLLSLSCSENQLTDTGILPNGLKDLNCSDNPINNIGILPNGLEYLNCSNCNLSVLGSLPNSLLSLSCWGNSIYSLVLPQSLTTLNCSYNSISICPFLPPALEILYCGNNMIDSIPSPIPSSLILLDCEYNNLTYLPSLPPGLVELNCANNHITTLPALPNSLENLNCSSMTPKLQQLPALPSNLKHLTVSNNLLTSLPVLPPTLKWLFCSNNNLSFLPMLPDTLQYLIVNTNPQLTCLPMLGVIGNLNFSSTAVQCLPNYGQVTNSSPALSSMPLCDIFNTSNCDFYYKVGGKIFTDNNTNCTEDPGESPIQFVKMNLYQGGSLLQQSYSSQYGVYTMDMPLGTYTYSPDTTDVPYLVGCPPAGFHTSTLTLIDSTDIGKDFGLQCKPGFDIGVDYVNVKNGHFFPGQTALMNIHAGDLARKYNLYCAAGVSGTVTVTFSGPVQFNGILSGTLTPVVNQNVLVYTISNFNNLDPDNSFQFFLVTDTTAQAGQQVCITVDVSPLSNDNEPANNSYTHCFTVTNSFDPNDKQVSPDGDITPYEQWMNYTIRFQNTGTAAAQNITITDTLDSNLQEASFTFLGASHHVFVNVVGNVVKFTFPNINLPDSGAAGPDSKGWIQYKIKTVPNLPIGTLVENTANIYFDFNPPVITNTTSNLVSNITGLPAADWQIGIYPNPTAGLIHVSSPAMISHLKVFDLSGRTVAIFIPNKLSFDLDISHLENGIYLIQAIDNEKSVTSKRLIISH